MAVTVDGNSISEVSVDLADMSRWTVDGVEVWSANVPPPAPDSPMIASNASYPMARGTTKFNVPVSPGTNKVTLTRTTIPLDWRIDPNSVSGTLSFDVKLSNNYSGPLNVEIQIPDHFFGVDNVDRDDGEAKNVKVNVIIGKLSGTYHAYNEYNGYPVSNTSYIQNVDFTEGVGRIAIYTSATWNDTENSYGKGSIGGVAENRKFDVTFNIV